MSKINPLCFIFDIDGTLALMKDRGPFDWKKVGQDGVNKPVEITYKMISCAITDLVLQRRRSAVKMFIFSGRDSSCREQTRKWLKKNNLKYDKLYMRPEGDMRKDSIVKKELFEKHISGKYSVIAVFDDRQQVVDMWREMGLACFQVAKGDF
jgi:hypothetical protein